MKKDCTPCHKYRLNSAGFLVLRDMVRTFNIRKFSLKTTVLIICLHCTDDVAVSDLVYRSLAQNVSSDFFKRHILLSRLKTTPCIHLMYC